MRACELDTGSARYQAPRSHMMAEIKIDIISTTPKAIGCETIVESGKRCMILMATAIPPKSTQRKLRHAAMSTDFLGSRE